MTLSTSTNKAGPYTANGVTTQFSFTPRLFQAADLKVYLTDATTGAEQVLTSGFSTALVNGGLNGALVTFTTAPASGFLVTLVREVNYLQDDYDPSAGGTFFADVLEAAMDKRVMQVQQLKELADRSLRLPISASGASTQLPVPSPSKVIGWSNDGLSLINVDASTLATLANAGSFVVNSFVAGVNYTPGVTTQLTLTSAPGSVNNCEVTFNGVTQHIGSLSVSGTTLTFDAPIPVGVTSVQVRIVTVHPQSIPSDGTVDANKLAANAVTTAKIADAAITTGKVADAAVTTTKIADGAITGNKIPATSIAADRLAQLPFWAGVLNATEVAVSGAQTLQAGRMHRITVNANYGLALPPGSTNAVVALRVTNASTSYVTITGDGGNTIAGAASKTMAKNGTALLAWDGSGNWTTLHWDPAPGIFVEASSTAGQAVTANTTDMAYATESQDTHNAWNGTTFTAPIDGLYHVVASMAATTAVAGYIQLYIGGVAWVVGSMMDAATTGGNSVVSAVVRLAAGNTVTFRSSVTMTRSANAALNRVAITRIGEF